MRPGALASEHEVERGEVFVFGHAAGKHKCPKGQLIQRELPEDKAHFSRVDVFGFDLRQEFFMELGAVWAGR